MFNSALYNSSLFNDLFLASGEDDQDDIVFNGYSLQNSVVVTSVLLHDSLPEREVPTAQIPRNDGEFVVGDFWRKKIITISGHVKESSATLLEDEIIAMKTALAPKEKILDIKVDGVIRRYTATLINGNQMFEERRHYNITWVPFTLQFMVASPFGALTSYSEDLFVDKTDMSSIEFTVNEGTVRSKLISSLNFTAASGITEVTITNNTTGESITTTTSISALDLLVFDGEEFEVRKNGTAIDFSGFFPRLEPGSNSITIALTGTSGTFTLSLKHKVFFL